ncbi:MAG: filamentous hemagglutinin N-terminal domain-containing protein [Symploca sp. SIO1B1]|nr:filamentous hemagglutinin N-terminal domain-containing protein [Symploca sp. SIO1B1]
MSFFYFCFLTLITLFLPQEVFAQIIPDNTLPTNSVVQTTGITKTITNGTTVGNNLFHSFSQFNLSQGEIAYFNNLTTITNIITRVTGGQTSTIDGLLSTNGAANLLLINPSGINFNSNAQLNIGGSFLASTADSLIFEDGNIFSASNPNTPPLLAINVPVGLQYGSNPGAIIVENTGHNLTSAGNPVFSTLDKNSNPLGLRVQPNQTLALVGGEVTLDGGLLTAESGRIEIGSIVQGRVNLNSTTNGWTLSYPDIDQFGDIKFKNAALVDTSGNGGSGIQLVGRQITMTDASLVFVDSQGNLPGGKIVLQASESVTLSGNSPQGIFTGLRSQTVAAGKGAEIWVSSPSLILQEGSRIQSISFSNGEGGDINLEVPNLVQLLGASPVRTGATSDITANVLGSGNGGNINVSTTSFSALDGGGLAAVTDGAGNAGNVTIHANDSVEVIGFNSLSANPTQSILAAATRNSGAGGQISINTGRLTVRDGGRITASTIANGLGGSLTINASESVTVGRIGEGTSLRSIIAASAEANLPIHQIRGLSPIPSGDSGTMTINTPKLIVFEQGRVGVDNQGFGNAGELNINASQILLDTEGIISASTESGQGGNITLNVPNLLLLRHGSQITAEAGGTGDGGNITINSAAIALIEGSLINANAFQGTGGNIQMTLQGLFISPDSLITASSQLGIDGMVQINDFLLDPSSGLNQLPENLTDSTDQIVAGCTANANSQFMITGRGGLPEDPTATIRGQTIWQDLQNFSTETAVSNSDSTNHSLVRAKPMLSDPVVEATGWIVNKQGHVELVAHLPQENFSVSYNCN